MLSQNQLQAFLDRLIAVLKSYQTSSPFPAAGMSGGIQQVDVINRPGRDLGNVNLSPGAAVDVTDRPVRSLGNVGLAPGATVDVSDRSARQLGNVGLVSGATVGIAAGSTVGVSGGVDVSDRAARALGNVGLVSGAAVDVTDRAARALGNVGLVSGAAVDVTDRVTRQLGVVRGALALKPWDWQYYANSAGAQVSVTIPASGTSITTINYIGFTCVNQAGGAVQAAEVIVVRSSDNATIWSKLVSTDSTANLVRDWTTNNLALTVPVGSAAVVSTTAALGTNVRLTVGGWYI